MGRKKNKKTSKKQDLKVHVGVTNISWRYSFAVRISDGWPLWESVVNDTRQAQQMRIDGGRARGRRRRRHRQQPPPQNNSAAVARTAAGFRSRGVWRK